MMWWWMFRRSSVFCWTVDPKGKARISSCKFKISLRIATLDGGHQRSTPPVRKYTSHIKLSTVYMYPHISSWRHSEKRADSNQARAYKAKRRGIKLTRETALAREKRIFAFSTSCVASKLAAKQAQLPQLCTFYPTR